jgi:septal ring factor EnvC (AmiA/AmiB activator)
VLLAGLSQIDAQPGQFVLAAEPVGTMSTVKQEPAGAQSTAPVLYIEFRKDGQPIDPEPWWANVHQKAQG